MIWVGGPEKIEKKKYREALLQEKVNLKRPSTRKNSKGLHGKKISKALLQEKMQLDVEVSPPA